MSGTPILEFKDVSKSFGKIKALEGVSFSVKEGEFVFVVGPSGAGKTTLLRLILGEIWPTSGQIIFESKNVANLKNSEIPEHRQRIGVVFQDFKLLTDRTVRENIEVALAVKGVDQAKWKSMVDAVLKSVGLSERSELFPAQLSGGEVQRVSLARALAVNPKLIFADEPTGNLDWETGEEIMKLFEKVNKEGMTIIVSSHNQDIIEKMAKRVIKLKEGKVNDK
ncbi:MAG: cell division ATP-binding protein FtsE [Bdellovibrionota bacterium]